MADIVHEVATQCDLVARDHQGDQVSTQIESDLRNTYMTAELADLVRCSFQFACRALLSDLITQAAALPPVVSGSCDAIDELRVDEVVCLGGIVDNSVLSSFWARVSVARSRCSSEFKVIPLVPSLEHTVLGQGLP